MTTYIHTLENLDISPTTPIHNPTPKLDSLSLTDPALHAMTDLKKVTAITIDADSTIDLALEVMRHAGVRLLLVVDNQDLIIGLITARDIMGEKPLKICEQLRIRHDEVLVQHAMTLREELNFYDIQDVEYANVEHIINRLKEEGRHHCLVIERDEDKDSYYVRGIFSITQIGKQLGIELSPDGHVDSFSEFEQLIA